MRKRAKTLVQNYNNKLLISRWHDTFQLGDSSVVAFIPSACLKNSYTTQQVAVEGIWYITLAVTPRKYPCTPVVWKISAIARSTPVIFVSLLSARCCVRVLSSVFATSRGLVMQAAIAPDPAPDSICEMGLYFLL